MKPLDPLTLERVARLIIDIDGPFERRGYQLTQLLQRTAWPQPPEYDGSPRIPWLTDILISTDDPAAVSRLLCRICDPLEYDDGLASADIIRQELNSQLAAEQLTVTYVSGRPVLGQPSTDGHTTVFTAPDDLEARIRPLVSSEEFLQQLMERVTETQICEQYGAYGLTIIGIGSFAEALLLDVLTHRDPTLLQGFLLPNGKRIAPERASFSLLLDTARTHGWIQMDAHDFMKIVRDYRNFVHLRNQQERGVTPDCDTVGMCWGPVLAVLNDLETSR
ncbi:hypothetical protein [Streptomyces flavofungini]|uniref:Uncharacterized protein n=1 Tax=Streptomyces flavofungini TaxID=68200 RepID=A0ABS0XIX5_9ACTN|nr:hypothetical protein [Streptomyces flavofungini]MBJ3813152.1 hypothetical protein [Streptomyces flavofungini]GHC90048.1 hypothetical protein GCM10010349_78150 [Streptomyces flavofungini]